MIFGIFIHLPFRRPHTDSSLRLARPEALLTSGNAHLHSPSVHPHSHLSISISRRHPLQELPALGRPSSAQIPPPGVRRWRRQRAFLLGQGAIPVTEVQRRNHRRQCLFDRGPSSLGGQALRLLCSPQSRLSWI